MDMGKWRQQQLQQIYLLRNQFLLMIIENYMVLLGQPKNHYFEEMNWKTKWYPVNYQFASKQYVFLLQLILQNYRNKTYVLFFSEAKLQKFIFFHPDSKISNNFALYFNKHIINIQSTIYHGFNGKHPFQYKEKFEENCFSGRNGRTYSDGYRPHITGGVSKNYFIGPVSYTHLTLPTICSVQISVVAVSLKKKKVETHDIITHAG
eukprot:TRINITY_DN36148_c0_g1_i1.p1 TRINITY_DN36148_c0_g1~~TRINITY_DN36148_c0_g1_i1.p1  ORF type:complete len:206 (-),score=14.82 TRINITY_DN36148_c0_g1_i1:14-631(-)